MPLKSLKQIIKEEIYKLLENDYNQAFYINVLGKLIPFFNTKNYGDIENKLKDLLNDLSNSIPYYNISGEKLIGYEYKIDPDLLDSFFTLEFSSPEQFDPGGDFIKRDFMDVALEIIRISGKMGMNLKTPLKNQQVESVNPAFFKKVVQKMIERDKKLKEMLLKKIRESDDY